MLNICNILIMKRRTTCGFAVGLVIFPNYAMTNNLNVTTT